MLVRSVRMVRTSFRVLLLSATVGLLGLVALSHVLPAVGRELYIVRGASMTPAISVGSAVVVSHVTPDAISAGDVITFRGENDTVITHRVTAVPASPTDAFHTKGDASEAADPFAVPAHAVIGRVEAVLPVAGTVLIMLGTTLGAVATLALLGGLAVAVWFMDELHASLKRPIRRRAVAEAC